MALEILGCVESLLEEVKKRTGKEVLLFESDQISSMAESKTARNGDDAHYIAYSKNYTPEINHIIASKALQILRTYNAAPKDRVMPVAYQEHINNARMAMTLETSTKPHLQVALNDPSMTGTWVLSLVNQLISQPANINLERVIYNDYPELREFQQSIISNQFRDFNATLSKEVEGISPSLIYNSSAIMNYVYLRSMDSITGSCFIDKLNYTIKKSKSEKLYNYTKDNLENNIISDKAVIDHWASFLNIENWYTWTDFEDIIGENSDE